MGKIENLRCYCLKGSSSEQNFLLDIKLLCTKVLLDGNISMELGELQFLQNSSFFSGKWPISVTSRYKNSKKLL